MEKKKKIEEINHETIHGEPSIMSNTETDPLGMYTGVPLDQHEVPTQDADDL